MHSVFILYLPSLYSSGDTSRPQGAYDISLDYQDRNTEPARGWGTAHGFPAAGDTKADTLLEPMRLRPAGQYNESSTQNMNK